MKLFEGQATSMRLRVCLFGGEIGWMENFEEKIGRETFLECVWGLGVFFPSPPKSSPKNGEKTGRRRLVK